MGPSSEKLIAIILAGKRPGQMEASNILVPIAGTPAIERVARTIRASTLVHGGFIVGPDSPAVETNQIMRTILGVGDFKWIEPAIGPSASALRALDYCARYPVLLTAGDHPLLTPTIVDGFCRHALTLSGDFLVGLVPHETVLSRFPKSQRTTLRFSDGAFCGSNLFLIKNANGKKALRLWTRMESNRKRPWRTAARLGWVTMFQYLSGRLSSKDACRVLSATSDCEVTFCPIEDARAAIDVDSDEDLQLVERILADE
jgi:CTP:molybdopterin cytidylyltransferase MocA